MSLIQEKLYLTDNTAYSFVTQTSKCSSRFVSEIDEDCIRHLNEEDKKHISIFDELKEHKTYTQTKSKTSYKKGDIVIHTVFKEGVVLSEKDGILEIAFSYPHGVKKILASHPSIKKKEILS